MKRDSRFGNNSRKAWHQIVIHRLVTGKAHLPGEGGQAPDRWWLREQNRSGNQLQQQSDQAAQRPARRARPPHTRSVRASALAAQTLEGVRKQSDHALSGDLSMMWCAVKVNQDAFLMARRPRAYMKHPTGVPAVETSSAISMYIRPFEANFHGFFNVAHAGFMQIRNQFANTSSGIQPCSFGT